MAAGLIDVEDCIAEWKWDGIRGQVSRRGGQTFVWSGGEELMEGRWPEVERAAEFLPDGTVLDGEILASRFDGDRIEVLPFAELQRRIGRKTVGKKLLAEVPVIVHAFDCLEFEGVDVRAQPLSSRRKRLRAVVEQYQPPGLYLNPTISVPSWSDLAEIRSKSRDHNAEGVMIKRKDAAYAVGPVRGVKPELVMELAFEGLQRSARHKSGIATRFPRIVRIRKDKTAADADKLDDLIAMLEPSI